MSYFDDASLVMIPSGYKDQKVYSVKPLDGSGDLTFSRASSATRVASNGLIEKVRTNYCRYSQDFASWTLQGSTTRTTGVTDPNGGTTAATISNVSTTGDFTSGIRLDSNPMPIGAGNNITASVYLKGSGTIGIALERSVSGTYFFQTTSVTLTSSWVRYTFSPAIAAAADGFQIYVANFTGSTATSFSIAFAQVELGDVATDYIATTSAAVSVGPVSGLPRLDYLNSTCPRLLLEPQRTNTSPYSEQFTSGWASSAGSPVTANTTISPSGYQDADTIAETGNGNYLYQAVTTSSGTFTVSVFAKKGSSTNVGIGLVAGGFTAGMSVQFNFDTQTFATPTNHGSFTSISATSQSYGNGWYRLALTGTTASATTYFFVLGSLAGSAYAANVRLWGAQCEAGAYATSYIPTLGTSVTRVADAASKTGISSLIGQTEGTIFIDVENNETETSCIISTNAGAGANSHIYIGQSGNNLALYVRSGGTYSIIASSIANVIGRKKIALAYGASFARIYMNGTQVYNSTAAVIPSGLDRIEMNVFNTSSDIGNVKFNQALYFTTKLTDTQLAELTTL